MTTNNLLLKFLQETFQRFSTKSPKFFLVWSWISGVLVVITGLPELLATFDVALPQLLNDHVNTAVKWAARASLFMSLMTTQSKPVAVTQEGEVVKKTNTTLLPFTSAQEMKTAVKKDVPVVENITNNEKI